MGSVAAHPKDVDTETKEAMKLTPSELGKKSAAKRKEALGPFLMSAYMSSLALKVKDRSRAGRKKLSTQKES